MPRNMKLLLTENVDSLGIVGDVVNVRLGYARNYLLPRNYATAPSDEKIKELAGKRAEAQRMLAELRSQREATTEKLKGVEITLVRSCNDQGVLYGAITQADIAAALGEQGYTVKPREIRIAQAMKRIDNYDVHIRLDSDLDATIKIHVKPDRELPKADDHHAPAPGADDKHEGKGRKGKGEGAPAQPEPEAKPEAKKPAFGDAGKSRAARESTGEPGAKKGEKPEKADKKKK